MVEICVEMFGFEIIKGVVEEVVEYDVFGVLF